MNMKNHINLLILSWAFLCAPLTSPAEPVKTFDTPEAAVSALVSAVEKEDTKQLHEIFGQGSDALLESGDRVRDLNGRRLFLSLYNEQHTLQSGPSGVSLVIGKEQWPFPVPVISEAGRWNFDLAAGKEEIINRRIGENELSAIEFCNEYVKAQKEYFSHDRDWDGFQEYAKYFVSAPGTRTGLFWFRRQGERPSPLGPVAVKAFAEGYLGNIGGSPQPFHGYYFRILTAQGKNAPGGEKSYITAGGRMTDGFAMVAYPARWEVSGIMTFLVDKSGKVLEKNLGPRTEALASAMKSYDPDPGWKEIVSADKGQRSHIR